MGNLQDGNNNREVKAKNRTLSNSDWLGVGRSDGQTGVRTTINIFCKIRGYQDHSASQENHEFTRNKIFQCIES